MSKEPKRPILVIPYKKAEYPRVEVYIDLHGATIGTRSDNEKKLMNHVYCGNNPAEIIRLIDEKILTESLVKTRRKEYEPTLKNFVKIVKTHNKFMESIFDSVSGDIDGVLSEKK